MTGAASRAPVFWIVFGWAAHALFAVTVYYLFWYLLGPTVLPATTSTEAVFVDLGLALQFAFFHSVLLLPSVRERLTRRIPSPAYGVFFCLCTCVSLVATIGFWQPCGGAVWHLTGSARVAMRTAFFATWIALFYSLSLSGFGYQTGWTTWRPWSRGLPAPRRGFQPRGVYHWFRHPIYLSFMGLIWLTPSMTLDRVVLTVVWTAYILIGSHLKDRRLVHYVGDEYRAYQARVPGYPGMFLGPLGRVRNHSTGELIAPS